MLSIILLPRLIIIISCSRIPGLKIRTHDSGLLSARPEVAIRPKDRTAMIREQIETALQQQKEHDHHWDDMIDVRLLSSQRLIHVLIIPLERISTSSGSLHLSLVQICTPTRHPILATGCGRRAAGTCATPLSTFAVWSGGTHSCRSAPRCA